MLNGTPLCFANTPFLSLFLLIAFLLHGCIHVISKEIREKASPDLTFQEVREDPERHSGKTVVWGGIIIDTLNRPDASYIKVLQTPLDPWGEPREMEVSQGRFLAKTPLFLDPEIYQKGRKITVAGTIIGREVQPLGEISYSYPLIRVQELHLWKEIKAYPHRYPFPYDGYYWEGYFYPPGWRFYPHPPFWW